MPLPESDAVRAFTRHCHDAFFRAILSDSERANALIHAHWPKALRWMLAGEPARPIDPALVHVDLRQTRADKVYLVGGTLDKPNAVAPIEHISSPGPDTPGQVAASLHGLQASFVGKDTLWAVPFAFSTRRPSWNVPGAIDETGSATDILRQLTWAERYLARVTRKIPYQALSPEPVSRAMVCMMNIACLTPYPVDELRRIWSTDLGRRRIDLVTLADVLSYALATSDIMKETLRDLALDAGLEAREIDMDLITMDLIAQPLILDALAVGEAKGRAEGRADILLHLFRQRFGAIPEGVEVKVRLAQRPDLEAWADALFDARKLDDVFRNGGADLITQPLILDALAEGEAKGRAEGRADILLHLFRQRFGAIPEGVEVKVRSAQRPDLEAWADALFDARKLDDVFQNGGAR